MLGDLLNPAFYAFNPFAIPQGVTGLSALTMGIVVLWRERGSQVSRAFFVMVLAASIYLFGMMFRYLALTDAAALAWARLAYLGIPFLGPAIYTFVVFLLGLRESRGLLVGAAWTMGVVFSVLALRTDLLVDGTQRYWWGAYDHFGPGIVPFLAFFALTVAASEAELIRAFRTAVDAGQKRRARSFAILLGVATLAGFDYLPGFGIQVLPLGFLAVLAFLVGSATTVARYHLVDITAAFAADQILATMAEPVLVCDVEGRIRLTNDAAHQTFGYAGRSLLRRRLSALGGDHETELALESMLVGPDVRERQLALRAASGVTVDSSISVSSLLDRAGHRVGCVVVARDIRQQKRIEAALAQSERYFRALIERSHDIIMVTAADGTVLYESPSAERTLGRTPSRMGRDIFDAFVPEDQERVRPRFEACARQPGAHLEEEIRLVDGEGALRHLEVRVRNLLHEPAVRGMVANIRDITESRAMEEQLREHQRLESVGRLAGGIAHDFNNLLTAIQGHIYLLLEDPSLPAEAAEELRSIKDGAERAEELTRQLMAFSRQQVRRPAIVDLNEVVARLSPILSRLIGERIVLVTELAEKPVRVWADARQLDQVLMNLAMNAVDAMHEGGRLDITTSIIAAGPEDLATISDPPPPGDYGVLRVRDNGHGMDRATLERVFEPFFSNKPPGQGSGLGLSTVYGIARQSGGYVTAASEPGDGATFQVMLPLATEHGGPDAD